MSQLTFDELFAEDKKEIAETPVASPLQQDILGLVQSGETSALRICLSLIDSKKLPNELYSTGKPKAYGQVCSILDSLVHQGELLFVEDKDKKDRIYRWG